MADDYIPVEPVRNVRARLGFENASPRATDRRAGEDPAGEQTESDQAPPAQNRLATETRAERERRRMAPAQTSALNAALGSGAAPQDDDVQVDDEVVGNRA